MNDYSILKISGLPGIFPDDSFYDLKYIYNRIERVGIHEEIIKTEKKLKTLSDSFYRERIIQVCAYDKYSTFFPIKENSSFDNIKYAENVMITLTDGVTVHQCMVTDFSVEKISNSSNKLLKLTYADVNSKNYPDYKQPVSDFFKSDYVYSQYGIACNRLVLSGLSSTQYYTKIAGITFNSKPEALTDEQNGLLYASRITSKLGRRYTFYVSEAEAAILQRDIAKCIGGGSLEQIAIVDQIEGITYTNSTTEFCNPEIKQIEDAVDLWQLDIELFYQNDVYNPYE